MAVYQYFLKAYGLQNLFCEDVKEVTQYKANFIIRVNTNLDVEKKVVSTANNCKFTYILNYAYHLFIFCNISWFFLLAFVASINERLWDYIEVNLFSLIYPILYLINLPYFHRNHFIKVVERNKNYEKYVDVSFVLASMISVTLTIVDVGLMYNGCDIGFYNSFVNESSGFFVFAMAISLFYRYNIFLTNIIIFSTMLIIHSIEIGVYSEDLSDFIEQNNKSLTIESIIKDYSTLKEHYANSVGKLNSIFSTITLLGVISMYFLVLQFSVLQAGLLQYVEAFFFVLTECIYIYSLTKVKDSISDIVDSISSPAFISKFLLRQELKGKETDDMLMRLLIKENENSTYLDWIVLYTNLNTPWTNFNIGGFDLDDTTLLRQMVTIIAGLLMALNISSLLLV